MALGLAEGIEDFLGIVITVVLGCTTKAFLSPGSPRAAGIEGLLRRVVRDRAMVVDSAFTAANISWSSDRPENKKLFDEAGGIDEVGECTTAAYVSPLPTAELVDAILVEAVGTKPSVVGVSRSNISAPPAKPETETMSDEDSAEDDVCEGTTTAFNLSFGKSRSGTVPAVAVVLGSLRDIVTEFRSAAVTADEVGARSKPLVVRAEVAGLAPVFCPEDAYEFAWEATGADVPVNAGSAVDGFSPFEVILPDGVPVTPTILPDADDSDEPEMPLVKIMDCNVDAGSEGMLVVALEDELSPGMSSGKHVDPRGIEYAYKVCDHEGFTVSSSSPSSASICRSTSISTSLSSLTPVIEEPAPHTPSAS